MNHPDESLIPLDQFCISCGIEVSFVHSLSKEGLCELVVREESTYIVPEHLAQLERLARLHYEMEINLEGLHAIVHLQEKITDLEEEVRNLRRKLRRHQSPEYE
ncbi:MerR HTH family regulatory protein [Cyclobacterium xiamenense]|jgi:hypothetical protein|uniref:MerR HTH family regulatory protein n=1 Tax=Cyclobacterium xiamenense TaxID=1297121 RepID=A0A1H6U2N2_9BACT|nr:chaperone modulator CbpM [Cyclobacterium xiamenense]SEI86618.1 MerR HTH family regulatory protein [Cyclobacterium xiamenense]